MKHTRGCALAVVSIVALAAGAWAHAQSSVGIGGADGSGQGVSDALELQEVVVTAKSIETDLPAELAQYGTRVDTVSAAQIKTGGFLDVAQTLEAVTPGFYVADRQGPFSYVNLSLQGGRTEDVLWLVDDIRINDRLYASVTPLDTLPASMIDHIEVLDGGQSLYYGTQAVSGAVNIVTKSFTDHPDGAFSLGADSNNGKHLDGYFRDALDQNYFVLYGTHDESPGVTAYPWADYQPSGTQRRRGYNVTTLGGKYAFDFTDALGFSATYQRTDATLDDPSPTTTSKAYNRRDEDLLSTNWNYVPSDTFKIDAKGYYHRWSSYYTEYDNSSTAYSYTPGVPGELTVADDNGPWGFKDYGANLKMQFALAPGLQAVAGYDLQEYIGKDSVLVIQQQTETVNALFAQLRTTPALVRNLHLAIGARYDDASFGPSASIWNAGAQYDLLPSLYLKANAGTAFRLPTDEELFANDPRDEQGNPNLRPESSHNANVAVGGTLPASAAGTLQWELMTYYRSVRDLIDYQSFDEATDQDVFGNVPGIVRTLGEQLTLNVPVTAWLSANFSANYNHARQSGTDRQFDRIPVSLAKLNVDYHPPGAAFSAYLSADQVGSLADEPFGDGTQVGYGNYTIVGIGGHYLFGQGRHQRIDVHLDNVFNHVYYAGVAHAETDADATPYVVHDLALPRTLKGNYTYSF